AFVWFGNQTTVGYSEWVPPVPSKNRPLVVQRIIHHDAPHSVHIRRPTCHRYRIFNGHVIRALYMSLADYVTGNHPTGISYVKVPRPAGIIDKLVFRQPPSLPLLLECRINASYFRIILIKIQEPLGKIPVSLPNGCAFGIRSSGIGVVDPKKVV